MHQSPIIEVKNVSKRYTIGFRQENFALRDTIMEFFRKKKRADRKAKSQFWALRNVSFTVAPGESLGIIGKNGAGKSTLLKLISRITTPTEGEIILRGKVTSLLEVGTGFHMELTGRENVFLNGSILGMSQKSIKKKFKEIVQFAEIHKFLDTPVKFYSSGMYMRLAFAVAAHLEPEILIIDEVLSVGDNDFQKKCMNKIAEMTAEGRTIIYVSHNMSAISNFTSKCILLENGRLVKKNEPKKVIQHYVQQDVPKIGEVVYEVNDQLSAQLLRVAVLNDKDNLAQRLDIKKDIIVDVSYSIRDRSIGKLGVYVAITLPDNTIMWNWDSKDFPEFTKFLKNGKHHIRVIFPGGCIVEGNYIVRATISLNGKAYHNHPNYGSGVNIELMENPDILVRPAKAHHDGIIARKPTYQLLK